MAAHVYVHRYKGTDRDVTYYHCLAADPGARAPTPCELREYLMLSQENFEQGLGVYEAKLERSAAPIRGRLAVLDDLLADKHLQTERLLDLYLSGDLPKEFVTERKVRLVATAEALEKERDHLTASLENPTLPKECVATTAQFAAQAARGLELAGDDIQTRRALLRTLAVSDVLTVENGERVLYVKCGLGEAIVPIAARTSLDYHPR